MNSQILCCVLGKSDHSLSQTLNGRPNYSGSRTQSNTENSIDSMENQLNSSGKISQDSQHWRFFTEFNAIWRIPTLNSSNSVIESFFMSIFTDIDIYSTSYEVACTSTSDKGRQYASNFVKGHWAFIGPETKRS